MKKVITFLLAVFCLTVTNAQEVAKKGTKGTPKATVEQRAQKSVDKLNPIVGLTDDQKTKIYDFALARAKKTDEIRAMYKGQADKKEQMKMEIKENRKTYRTNTKSVLTPEQLEKLKAYHKANKATKKKGAKPSEIPAEEMIPEIEE